MVEEAQLWSGHAPSRTMRDRVAIKAVAMVEELLIDAVGIVQNPDIPGAARVQACSSSPSWVTSVRAR